MQITITKRYGRKLAGNLQSFNFETEVSQTVEVSTPDELMEASNKIFQQAKGLTELDIEQAKAEVYPIIGKKE